MSQIKIYDESSKEFVSVASDNAADIVLNSPNYESDNVEGALEEVHTEIEGLKQNVAWIYNNGTIGGGGGGSDSSASGTIVSETFLNSSKIFKSTTEDIRIHYKVTSKRSTNFNLTLKLNTTSKNVTVKPNMDYYWDVGKLASGQYDVFISGTDSDNLPLDYFSAQIVTGALEIISDFDDTSNIFNVASTVSIPYQVNSYLNNPITVEYSINGGEPVLIEDVPKGVSQKLVLGKLSVGNYSIKMQATSQGETVTDVLKSNIMYWDIKVAGTDDIFIVIPSNTATKYNIGLPINLKYSIITSAYSTFILTYKINNLSGTTVQEETFENVSVGDNYLVISTDGLQAGEYDIVLSCKVRDDQSVVSKDNPSLRIQLITDADFTPWVINKTDIIAHFTGRNKNKNELNTWKNEIPKQDGWDLVTCTMSGMNGTSTGFIEGKNALVIGGESYAVIDYPVFRTDNYALNGTTISIIYKIKNNGNQSARVIDCGNYDMSGNLVEGINITASNTTVKTSNTSSSTKVGIDDFIDQTFVLGGPVGERFIKIYMNGVLTSCKFIDNNDSLSYDGKIYLGCRRTSGVDENNKEIDVLDNYAECEIKEIKIYKRALTSDQVVYNYICDDYYMHTIEVTDEEGNTITQYDKTAQLNLRSLNSMSEDGTFKVDTTNTSPFPIVEIDFGSDSTTREQFKQWIDTIVWGVEDKFQKFPCTIRYNDYANKISVTKSGDDTFIRLQGTSSTGYTRKSFDIGFGINPDNNKDFLFTPKPGDWLPENIFTLKCNMMDSSHANNIGTGNLLSEYFLDKYPPMKDSANNVNYKNVRAAVDGFPCILLCDLGGSGEGGGTSMTYMGIYTFNLGRTSYYNLGLKNYEFKFYENNRAVVESFTDKMTGYYSPDTTFAFEVGTSSNDGAGAFKQISEEWINNDWTRRYPTGSSAEADKQLRRCLLLTGQTTKETEYEKDLAGNIKKDSKGNPIVAYQPGEQFNDLQIWNKSSLVDYIIMVYMLGMTDNLGKNLVIKSWEKNGGGDSIWYATFYDMDTILGVDNTGSLTYGPEVDIDAYPTGDFNDAFGVGRGKGQYNLSNSRLWNNVREYNLEAAGTTPPLTADYIKTRYAYWRNNGILTADNVFQKFKDLIKQIGATYYNKDAEIKYLTKFTNADGVSGYHNLSFLNGTREIYTKNWIQKRIVYLDSIFDYGNIKVSDSSLSKPVKFRFNVGTASVGTRNIGIRSRSPLFIKVLWSGEDNNDDFQKLLVDGINFTTFSKNFNANFQSTDLTFGPEIMYMRDLNDGNPSVLRLEYCQNLMELDLAGNTFLKLLVLTGTTSLRKLNLSHCSKLGTALSEDEAAAEGTTQSDIDLSLCTNLQSVDISYTGLSQLKLPSGGTLKSLICNNSGLQKMELYNQSFLESVDFTNCTNLTSIVVTNCENLKSINLTNASLSTFKASNCPNLEEVILDGNIRLKSVSFSSTDKLKKLSLVGCNNNSLGFYSGDEVKDNETALNLLGCPNLEELDLTRCSAQVIYFNGDCTSLKKLKCDQSSIKQTIIGGKSDGTTQKHFSYLGSKPAFDLINFTLDTIEMTNCTSLINVINIKPSTVLSFKGCSFLERITGNLVFTGTVSSTFYQCTKFTLQNYSGKNPRSLISSDWDLNIDMTNCTALNSVFYGSGVTLNDVIWITRRIGNIRQLNTTFYTCPNIITNSSTPLPEDLFSEGRNLTSIESILRGNPAMTGPFPVKILYPCTKLSSAAYSFWGCKFTSFYSSDGTEPHYMFLNNTELTNLTYYLASNNCRTDSPMNARALFRTNTKLVNISLLFSGNSNMEISLENSAAGYTGDEIFCHNPNLTSINNAFNGVSLIGNLHPNIFGGVTGPTDDSDESNVKNYPVKLTDIRAAFYNTGIGGSFDDRLFQNLPNLNYADSFCAGSKSTAITGSIPKDLFANNTQLITVNGFFSGMSNLSGYIPGGLFRNNPEITSVTNLFNGCNNLTGSIPEELFSKMTKLVNVESLFNGCTKLTGEIPGKLFMIKNNMGDYVNLAIQSTASMFYRCYGLIGSIPDTLLSFMPNLINASNMFRGCGRWENGNTTAGLNGELPANLFANNPKLENLDYCFSECNQLSYHRVYDDSVDPPTYKNYLIPEGFFDNNPMIKSMVGCFRICGTIYDIPINTFTKLTMLENISYLFYASSMKETTLSPLLFRKCNRLTNISHMFSRWSDSKGDSNGLQGSLPSGLFSKYDSNTGNGQRLENVEGAFRGNINLTGDPIKFWEEFTSIKNSSNCYAYCSGLTGYMDNTKIPTSYGGGLI